MPAYDGRLNSDGVRGGPPLLRFPSTPNASKLRLEPVRRGGPIFPLRTDRERGVTS
jgi:hypothetical protein